MVLQTQDIGDWEKSSGKNAAFKAWANKLGVNEKALEENSSEAIKRNLLLSMKPGVVSQTQRR